MPSTHRSFVVSAAALLAGCVGSRGPAGTPDCGPTATPTDGPREATLELGETATVGELEVRPHDADVQDSYLALVYPDFADIVAREGRRFLFVMVVVGGPPNAPGPPVDDFSIVAGG